MQFQGPCRCALIPPHSAALPQSGSAALSSLAAGRLCPPLGLSLSGFPEAGLRREAAPGTRAPGTRAPGTRAAQPGDRWRGRPYFCCVAVLSSRASWQGFIPTALGVGARGGLPPAGSPRSWVSPHLAEWARVLTGPEGSGPGCLPLLWLAPTGARGQEIARRSEGYARAPRALGPGQGLQSLTGSRPGHRRREDEMKRTYLVGSKQRPHSVKEQKWVNVCWERGRSL